MAHLLVEPLPELRRAVLLCAWSGWSDAGEAATAAVRWLVRHLPARRIGGFDPEAFHVFTDTRPTVRVIDGERRITWPAHDIYLTHDPERERDLLFLVAREPELRWRTYCNELVSFARRSDIEVVVSMGAFLADAPHSRPVPLTGFASTDDWWHKLRALGTTSSDYQGPTSINGVLHDACRLEGLPSFSLWAAVPHYLPSTANPKAALALLRRLGLLLGLEFDLTRLENAADYFVRRVNEAVSRDRRAGSILRELEARADQPAEEQPSPPPGPLPSADDVIRDLEEFLRGRARDEGE